jgi:hypothetical protein
MERNALCERVPCRCYNGIGHTQRSSGITRTPSRTDTLSDRSCCEAMFQSRRSSGRGGADVLVEAEAVDWIVVRFNGG